MQSKNKSKEVSREVHELASSLEEKPHTRNKSCKDGAKREEDILKLAEMAANDEKQENEERHNINKRFKKLRKERKEDQARASATEQKLSGRYDEYMRT